MERMSWRMPSRRRAPPNRAGRIDGAGAGHGDARREEDDAIPIAQRFVMVAHPQEQPCEKGDEMPGRPSAHARSVASIAFAAAALMAQPLSAAPVKPAGAAPRLPADAQAYVTRRRGCNHWGGEDAYDEARGREIAAAAKALRCDAVDADEARLRRRYGKDPAVLKAFDRADGESG